MVDLFTTSGAASPRPSNLVLTQAPEAKLSGAQLERPYQEVARAVHDLGETVEKASAPLQREAGMKSVALDADGNPQVYLRAELTASDKAWNEGALQAGLAKANSASSQQIAQMRADHANDPVGFQEAMGPLIQKIREGNPHIAPYAEAHAQQVLDGHFQGLLLERKRTDQHNEQIALHTQIGDQSNAAMLLARQGGVGTPEYKRAEDQVTSLYQALGDNPAYAFPPEKVESEIQKFRSLTRVSATLGSVERTYGKAGMAEAVRVLNTEVRDNPDLRLSMAERDELIRTGLSHINQLAGANKAAVAANKASVTTIIDGLKKGVPGAFDAVEGAIAQSTALGDTDSTLRLSGEALIARLLRGARGGTDEEKLRVLTSPVSQGPIGTDFASRQSAAMQFFTGRGRSREVAAGIVGNLAFESGGRLDPNAINRGDGADGSDSIGIGQWNGSRAVALKEFARAQGKPWNDLATQLAFVDHEMSTGADAGAGRAHGMLQGARTVEEATNIVMNHYERPDPTRSKINDRIQFARNAHAAPVSAVTPSAIEQNPFARSALIRAQMDDETGMLATGGRVADAIMAGIDKSGTVPAPETLAAVYQVNAAFGGKLDEKVARIEAKIQGNAYGDAAAGQPQGAGLTLINAAKERAQGSSILQQVYAEAAQTSYTRGVQLLKADPHNEAYRRTWITRPVEPLNFDDGAALDRALAQRGESIQQIAGQTGDASRPAFSDAELPAVKSVLTNGSLDQRLRLLTATSVLPESTRKATMKQLASDDDGKVFAVAGSVARFSPDVARDIISGQTALAAEKKLGPKEDSGFHEEVVRRLPTSDFPSETRAALSQATMALYAKMSEKANDTTGALNTRRLDAALAAVTGGVLDSRGSKVIAPWYGATQANLDQAIRSLSDADFAGARTADGSTFPASALQASFSGIFTSGNWRLQSYGDGKYLVMSGATEAPRYLLREILDARDLRGPFVLDLSGKRDGGGQVAAAAPTTLATTWPPRPVDQP